MSAPSAGQRRLVIVGATGMVGGYALRYALDHPAVERVTAIGRRKLGISHPKLDEVVHRDFADCSALAEALSDQDAAVFCLGIRDPSGDQTGAPAVATPPRFPCSSGRSAQECDARGGGDGHSAYAGEEAVHRWAAPYGVHVPRETREGATVRDLPRGLILEPGVRATEQVVEGAVQHGRGRNAHVLMHARISVARAVVGNDRLHAQARPTTVLARIRYRE